MNKLKKTNVKRQPFLRAAALPFGESVTLHPIFSFIAHHKFDATPDCRRKATYLLATIEHVIVTFTISATKSRHEPEAFAPGSFLLQ